MSFLSKLLGTAPQEPLPEPLKEKPKNPRVAEIGVLLQSNNLSEYERNQLIFERNALIRGEAAQISPSPEAIGVAPSSPVPTIDSSSFVTAKDFVNEPVDATTEVAQNLSDITFKFSGEPKIPAFLLKENEGGNHTQNIVQPIDNQDLTPTTKEKPSESIPVEKTVKTREEKVATVPVEEKAGVTQQPKITLHYSIGGKDQTFVVGGENQLPNLNSIPTYTSAPAAPTTSAPEELRGEGAVQTPAQERTISATTLAAAPVAATAPNTSTPTPAPRVEMHTNQSEHAEENLPQEKKAAYIAHVTAKGYPKDIFFNCSTEADFIKTMGNHMKEKYISLGYPENIFSGHSKPSEISAVAKGYKEEFLATASIERADLVEKGRAAAQRVTTPEALSKQDKIDNLRGSQDARANETLGPSLYSRVKPFIPTFLGTTAILGACAAAAFIWGKTCTVPAPVEAPAAAAPVAAAIQDCQKQKEVKEVKKKVAAAVKKTAPVAAVATVRVKEASETIVQPQVVPQGASTDVVTAVPSAPATVHSPAFANVLPQSIPMAQGGGAGTTVIQQTVWNPAGYGFTPWFGNSWGRSFWGVSATQPSGGGSAGIAPRPGTAPVGGATPVQPPQVQPPVPGPVTGGIQVPPPIGGPSVGGPSIGAPVLGGVSGPRPNTSAPTVNAPIIGGGYSGGVPNIGAPSGGGSFGNSGAPIVRPPTVNAPISNGSYSNNSSYSSGGNFVGGPSFGGSGGAPMVSAPNGGGAMTSGAPMMNTQTGGSSQPSVSGPRFGTR